MINLTISPSTKPHGKVLFSCQFTGRRLCGKANRPSADTKRRSRYRRKQKRNTASICNSVKKPRRFNIAAGLTEIRRECMQNMIIKHYLSFVFSGAGINFLRRTRRYLLKNAITFSARFCNGHPRGAWQKPLFRFAPLAV